MRLRRHQTEPEPAPVGDRIADQELAEAIKALEEVLLRARTIFVRKPE